RNFRHGPSTQETKMRTVRPRQAPPRTWSARSCAYDKRRVRASGARYRRIKGLLRCLPATERSQVFFLEAVTHEHARHARALGRPVREYFAHLLGLRAVGCFRWLFGETRLLGFGACRHARS